MIDKETLNTKFGRARINAYGYYQIKTTKEGNHGKYLHRLVWEEYYDKSVPEGCVIHHRNGVKTDNRIENLQCIEHSKHLSLHKKGENHPMYGKNHTIEARKKMSKNNARYWKGKTLPQDTKRKMSENHADFSGKNNPRAKYTLWDIKSVHYTKLPMFDHGREPNPCKCFRVRYNSHDLPIGGFYDFVSCEIINELIQDAI